MGHLLARTVRVQPVQVRACTYVRCGSGKRSTLNPDALALPQRAHEQVNGHEGRIAYGGGGGGGGGGSRGGRGIQGWGQASRSVFGLPRKSHPYGLLNGCRLPHAATKSQDR